MANLPDPAAVSLTRAGSFTTEPWIKYITAGNPFYLVSAGLLLYGFNQLSTDPRLVGAEMSMLRFNFCALIVYEVMLVTTAIALARRRIWYDALLLIGLTNLFIIIPFSLISRAVYLNTQLAWVMSCTGALLAAGKFWAFKKYMPHLNLPGRLLSFGALLLLANAGAPLFFKAIANNPEQIKYWLNVIWLWVLPLFAGLACFLPQPAETMHNPAGRRWLPLAFYLAWLAVTAFHAGGIGYSATFDWDRSLAVPLLWVAAWTLYIRRKDFAQTAGKTMKRALLLIPLLLPLLAAGRSPIFLVVASLNLGCFILRFIHKDRSRPALIQLLGAAAILLGGLPIAWVHQVFPGVSRLEWIVLSCLVCFAWLIFLSRDPRLALLACVSLVGLNIILTRSSPRLMFQIGLVSILAHSLRWDDHAHKGARVLRIASGVLWLLASTPWLTISSHDRSLPIYVLAGVLLVWYGISVLVRHCWKPRSIPFFAAGVLLSEPGTMLVQYLAKASSGFLAIAASFVLFAAGSLAAFSKSSQKSSSAEPGSASHSQSAGPG